jgi:hypothetical protein
LPGAPPAPAVERAATARQPLAAVRWYKAYEPWLICAPPRKRAQTFPGPAQVKTLPVTFHHGFERQKEETYSG